MSNSNTDWRLIKKGLELLMRRLIDMRTLNVITAAGDFFYNFVFYICSSKDSTTITIVVTSFFGVLSFASHIRNYKR